MTSTVSPYCYCAVNVTEVVEKPEPEQETLEKSLLPSQESLKGEIGSLILLGFQGSYDYLCKTNYFFRNFKITTIRQTKIKTEITEASNVKLAKGQFTSAVFIRRELLREFIVE